MHHAARDLGAPGAEILGPGHRIVGAWSGAAAAYAFHLPAWQVGASAALAVVTAAGKCSPDADQSWLGFLGHRRHTYEVALAGAVCAAAWLLGAPWPVWALIVGWCSHLAADAVFGRPGYGRGPGVPVFGHYAGVGLKVGGWAERCAVLALVAAATVLPVALR